MEDFEIQDSVQLLHGYTPTMTIGEIKDGQALCVWYDRIKKVVKKEWLPLTTLKKTPEKTPIDKEELFKILGYRG